MFKTNTPYNKAHNGKMDMDDESLAKAGHKILHDLHDLKDDVHTLKDDVKSAARTAKSTARHTGAHMREGVEAVMHAPVSFVQTLRDKPVKSTLIALTVGLVIGRLYRR